MAKFKVGDKVVITNMTHNYQSVGHGSIGEIVKIYYSMNKAEIRFRKFFSVSFWLDELELAGPYGKHHMTAREICGGCE